MIMAVSINWGSFHKRGFFFLPDVDLEPWSCHPTPTRRALDRGPVNSPVANSVDNSSLQEPDYGLGSGITSPWGMSGGC